jgi:hypothetical protein
MGFERNGLNMLWAGMPGMRWSSIVPVFESMINCFGFPKAVIIHCGGNDIGCVSTGSLLFHLRIHFFQIPYFYQ